MPGVARLQVGIALRVLDLEDLDRVISPASLGAVPGTLRFAVIVAYLAQAPVLLVVPAETLVSGLQT